MSEWVLLNTMLDVAKAQADGWEIQESVDGMSWYYYDCKFWAVGLQYRGLKPPEKRIVTNYCWRHRTGGTIVWADPSETYGVEWVRFPAGDITGEIVLDARA